jgi:hydroxyacylglutathione hydrolase
MLITSFFDKGLAQLSYAILSGDSMVIIDPARNPAPYYQFAHQHHATITAVIETHLHADFISSHYEIRELTGARIYISRYARATFPHTTFDEGDELRIGKIRLKAIHTPGHSPDSICILLQNEAGLDYALFTGDTLLVNDVGRPDLRESDTGTAARTLARQLFTSLHQKIMRLPPSLRIYPGHGPGSLCSKNPGTELESTLGREKQTNPMLQIRDEATFTEALISGQPYIPGYFSRAVTLNRHGARPLEENLRMIPKDVGVAPDLARHKLTVDTRPRSLVHHTRLSGAIHIERSGRFETWLGSVIAPGEAFNLVAEDAAALRDALLRAASIGYETNIQRAIVQPASVYVSRPAPDFSKLLRKPGGLTILDVRSREEHAEEPVFDSAVNIPLPELRERIEEVYTCKPIAVHCASGYRSAIAASLLRRKVFVHVYDFGEAISQFRTRAATA